MREKAPSTAPLEGNRSRNSVRLTPASRAISVTSMSVQGRVAASRIKAWTMASRAGGDGFRAMGELRSTGDAVNVGRSRPDQRGPVCFAASITGDPAFTSPEAALARKLLAAAFGGGHR